MQYPKIDYDREFGLNPVDHEKNKEALKHALDIRKYEIDLYWKRATYFWAFIAATLVGYVSLQTSYRINPETSDALSVVVSCLGVLFSVAWFLVNKGSKFWQENWENHVDLLEDGITGPLYKVTINRPSPDNICERTARFITGPGKFSVSKINQIISFYVVILWCGLLIKSLLSFWKTDASNLSFGAILAHDWIINGMFVVTIITCAVLWRGGKTHHKQSYEYNMVKREVRTQD